MKRIILCLSLFAFFGSQAQQINPVPDYVFSNRMSVGRNAVTDTAAYFSIGPRYGAIRGFMPPMVVDTASVTGTKRNGLLIFSIQKNKFLYWDSVRVQWSDMAGSSGSYITGTLTNRYIPKATSSTTLGNSVMYDSSGFLRAYTNYVGQGSTDKKLLFVEVDGQNNYGLVLRQNDSLQNNIQYVLSIRKGMMTSDKPRPGFGAGYDVRLPDDTGAFRRVGSILHRLSDTTAAGLSSYMQFQVARSGNLVNPMQISADSSIRMAKLAGSGTRYVVADANGDLAATSATAIVDTLSISTRAWRQKGIDSVANVRIGGSGSTNRVAKFTASGTIGNSSIIDSSSSVALTITSGGNLGVDVTPSVWHPDFTALQIKGGMSIFNNGGNNFLALSSNAFTNTSLLNTYIASTTATRYRQDGGQHIWENAASGTAGNTISFNQALTLSASSELLINTSSDAGAYALQVAGSIYNTTGAVLAASSGDVKIGTTGSYGTSKLFVDGTGGISVRDVNGHIFTTVNSSAASASFNIRGAQTKNASIVFTENAVADRWAIGILSADANLYFVSGNSDIANGDKRMTITSAGNVGIGTTSPLTILDVASSANGYQTLRSTGAGEAMTFYQNTNTGTTSGDGVMVGINGTGIGYIYNWENQAILFGTNSTERMRITSAGELLLGGTTDVGAYILQAYGGFYNSGNALLNAASGETWIGGTDYGNYQLSVSNNMYVDGQSVLAGNGAAEVLLGTTSDAGTYRLQVAGNVYSTGTITTAAPSGGTAKPFKIGAAATVSPTSPNRTIEIEIDGTTYYLHAKTTND